MSTVATGIGWSVAWVAATTMMPVQDQKWAMTVSGESFPEALCSVVTVMPCQ